MKSVKSKNTKPELFVRSLLTQLGFRYRLHPKTIPGKPDIAFIKRKKAIFVNGCFWHKHSNCKVVKFPKAEFWITKLEKNVNRDLKVNNLLISSGWDVLTIWECEIKEIDELNKKISDFLK